MDVMTYVKGNLYQVLKRSDSTDIHSFVFGFVWNGPISFTCEEYVNAKRAVLIGSYIGSRKCLGVGEVVMVVDFWDDGPYLWLKIMAGEMFLFFSIQTHHYILREVLEHEEYMKLANFQDK